CSRSSPRELGGRPFALVADLSAGAFPRKRAAIPSAIDRIGRYPGLATRGGGSRSPVTQPSTCPFPPHLLQLVQKWQIMAELNTNYGPKTRELRHRWQIRRSRVGGAPRHRLAENVSQRDLSNVPRVLRARCPTSPGAGRPRPEPPVAEDQS